MLYGDMTGDQARLAPILLTGLHIIGVHALGDGRPVYPLRGEQTGDA